MMKRQIYANLIVKDQIFCFSAAQMFTNTKIKPDAFTLPSATKHKSTQILRIPVLIRCRHPVLETALVLFALLVLKELQTCSPNPTKLQQTDTGIRNPQKGQSSGWRPEVLLPAVFTATSCFAHALPPSSPSGSSQTPRPLYSPPSLGDQCHQYRCPFPPPLPLLDFLG